MSKQQSDPLPLFLVHLYKILTIQTFDEIIKWDAQRKGFVIIDKQKLTQDVLPLYYRHHNYCSFVRQLNMYGFRKSRSKSEQAFFFNQQFSINMPLEELKTIKRKITLKRQSNKENNSSKLINNKRINFDSFIKIANKQQNIDENQPLKKRKQVYFGQNFMFGNEVKIPSVKLLENIDQLSALSIQQQIKQSSKVQFCQSMKLLQSNKILFQRNQSISEQIKELRQLSQQYRQ